MGVVVDACAEKEDRTDEMQDRKRRREPDCQSRWVDAPKHMQMERRDGVEECEPGDENWLDDLAAVVMSTQFS